MTLVVVALPVLLLLTLAIHDRLQTERPELRVFPIIGRVAAAYRRRLAGDVGYPFTRDDLVGIRARALTGSTTSSFGATRPPGVGQPVVDLAMLPGEPAPLELVRIGDQAIPLLNFGALGFGPVSGNTILAVGSAARAVGCLQNTGEDGATVIHEDGGARLVWQIGTGYWGCREQDGRFSLAAFADTAAMPSIELIEVKLTQGAKPGAGGLLPAVKNTPHVARILKVAPHTDVVSPPAHSAWASPEAMLEWIARLADVSGKPVGIKMCIGSDRTAAELIRAIGLTGVAPAFITIDGAEGGSGAAPDDLQLHAGAPVDHAVCVLGRQLTDAGYRDRIRLLAAGRVHTGYDLFRLLCRGADGCFFTRAPMVAMGCLQARRCHTGNCPSGIATQERWRRSAVTPSTQGEQLARYYRTVMESYRQLLRASGRSGRSELDVDCLVDID